MGDGTRHNASPALESCDTKKYTGPFPCSLDPRHLFSLADSQFSDDVIEESAAEKLTPREALIGDNRCKNSSYLNHVAPEEIHESDNANLLLKSTEQECVPVKSDTLTTSVNSESVVFSINMNQDNLTQALELPLDDGNKNSQIGVKRFDDDESCFAGITREHLNELPELHYHQIESVYQPEEKYSVMSSQCESDQFQSTSENMSVKFSSEGLKLHSDDTEQTKVQQKIMQTQEDVSEGLSSKLAKKNHLIDSELVQNNSPVVDFSQEVDPLVSDCFLDDALKLPLVNASNSDKQSKSLIEDVLQNSSTEELKTSIKKAAKHSKQVSCQASKSRRKRYILRSLGHTDRVLRSRTRGNATTPKPTYHVSSAMSKRDRKGRKKNKRKEIQVADEFSKIRKCLRYLLHRMAYEQSFIAAYSGEGWKGYSLDKLKPEKELQRATNEIMRRKLKIRDLFKHLDLLCVGGRFSEFLFDSEGQIDSEDIFCAKCGSKEMSTTDDIILCDGACDRGFHQFCLEPPLLNEDIPPDDEGWLCPGCDCKVDCIDLLNDSQGTNYSLTDSWENVYPEAAAAAAAGHNNDQNFGLPSDDSDDNDFDPDGQETDDLADESSSDVSESNSESEKLEASPKDNQYVGLPSDDSDNDDDYNPGAPDTEENIKSESSSSDFTSDSENLVAILEDDRPSRNENDFSTTNGTNFPRGIDKRGSKNGRVKHSMKDELSSILELGPLYDGLSPIVSRRHVDRLDYKKLYDETYGNVSSDSSDDDDWTDIAAQRKKNCGLVSPAQQKGKSSVVKKEETYEVFVSDSSDDEGLTDIAAEKQKNCGLVSPAAQNGKSSVVKREDNVLGKHDVKGSEITPRKSARRTRTVADTNDSLIQAQDGSFKPGSTGGRAKSTSSKLGEAVVQRLRISFKENQYPDKHAKETLAKDLGLNFKQVSKWFENTRRSTRNPSHVKATANANIDESESALQKGTLMSHSTMKPEAELDTGHRGGTRSSAHLIKSSMASDVPPCESEYKKDGISGSHTTTRREPNSIRSRKRKGILDDMVVNTDASIMEKQKPLAGSSKAHEGQVNGHIRTRRQTLIATNTDSAQKSLVESSKANVDQENHRIRTRRQKFIA